MCLAPYRRWGGCLLSADLRLRSGRPLRQTSPRTLFCVVEPRVIGGALFFLSGEAAGRGSAGRGALSHGGLYPKGYSRKGHKRQHWRGSGEKQPPLERLSPPRIAIARRFFERRGQEKVRRGVVMTMHLLDPTGAAAALGAYAPLLHGWITTGGDTWTLAVGAAVVLFIRIRML